MFHQHLSKKHGTSVKINQTHIVSDSIILKFIDFLETKFWNLPIAHFIEQNSIVFDREQCDNLSIYEHTFEAYNNLINSLIDSYCEDTKINRETLINLLQESTKNSKLSLKKKVLFEPIIAAQNFDVFVPMMMRKNIELQLQALKVLKHLSELPSSLQLDKDDTKLWNILFNEDESERLILIAVLKQSKWEWERNQQINEEQWQNELELAKRNSLLEKQSLILMLNEEQKKIDNAIKTNEIYFANLKINEIETISSDKSQAFSIKNSNNKEENICSSVASFSNSTVEIKNNKVNKIKTKYLPCQQKNYVNQNQNEIEDKTIKSKESTQNSFSYRTLLKAKKDDISENDINKRSKYLREQRDKLIEVKRKERLRQLTKMADTAKSDRPRTAKAAQNALDNVYSKVETRRAIAAKLKANIIEKFTKEVE